MTVEEGGAVVDWDAMNAAAVPFSDVDPELAAVLLDVFHATLQHELNGDERVALDTIRRPPRLDVARVGDIFAIRLTFLGGSTWTEWDGTDRGAQSLVAGLAASAAAAVSGDHWIQGDGWQAWTGDGMSS